MEGRQERDVRCVLCGEPIDPARIDPVLYRAFCRPCGAFTALPGAPPPSLERALDVPREIEALRAPLWREREVDGARRMIVGPTRAARVRSLPGMISLALAVPYVVHIATLAVPMALGERVLMAMVPTFLAFAFQGVGPIPRHGLSALLNRVEVTIDAETIRFRERPIARALGQVPLREVASVEGAQVAVDDRGRDPVWGVRLLLVDGRVFEVRLYLDNGRQAQFVAARIEAALARHRLPRGYRD